MKPTQSIVSYLALGGLGLAIAANLQGCSPPDSGEPESAEMGNLRSDLNAQNFFLVIEQVAADPARYEIAERYPTEGDTRAVLRDLDGNERVMTSDELKALAEEEAARYESGTSALNEEPSATGGGLGLGATILAVAAGSLIGGMLANKLAGNANFQRHQQAVTRPTASISQPANRSSTTTAGKSADPAPKRGFGSTSSSRSSSRSGSFGG